MSSHPDFSQPFEVNGFSLLYFVSEWADKHKFMSKLTEQARLELVHDLTMSVVSRQPVDKAKRV